MEELCISRTKSQKHAMLLSLLSGKNMYLRIIRLRTYVCNIEKM